MRCRNLTGFTSIIINGTRQQQNGNLVRFCRYLHTMNSEVVNKVTVGSGRKVAVAQMCSTFDVDANLRCFDELMNQAKQAECQMVFFPEACDYVGRHRDETLSLAENYTRFVAHYARMAKSLGMWVSLGGLHVPPAADDTDRRCWNRHLVLNSAGEIAAQYDKLHLFDIDIPGKVTIKESGFSRHGAGLVPPVETPIGNVGLSTCYDLRFAELALWQRQQGAQILTYPSAFTKPTGEAHWHTLLRARAIETGCYVIAAAQCGRHHGKRESYGHALIVDPYGVVVADCGNDSASESKLGVATIDLAHLNRIRDQLPCHQHRRTDLYTVVGKHGTWQAKQNFNFADHPISASHVFYVTQHSFAFVNLKPVLEGHVLVASRRRVRKLPDLSVAEVADLFVCVQQVQRMIEQLYSVDASTITTQDGPDAGQTVQHVHVHILPRRPGDFDENNQIYSELAKHDKEGYRVARSESEMTAEAEKYRIFAQGTNL